MPTQHSQSTRSAIRGRSPHLGLLHWAERVLTEVDRAGDTLEPDPVHDLRVAIRRSRSMAQGLRSIDPVPEWNEFRALAKPAFSALGELRDVQVLQHWYSQLAPENDPLREAFSPSLASRETELKAAAHKALGDFDRKRWHKLAKRLDRRTRSLRPGSLVLQLVALERLLEAQRMHDRALRTRRAEDLHRLRIGMKHFRYTVENFLPAQQQQWKADLKRVQDLLGDVHDLDVLQAEIARLPNIPASVRESWKARIGSARASRLAEYVDMTGDGKLSARWRAGLASGRQLSMAVQTKLRRWSAALDGGRAHTRRVANVAVMLWLQLSKVSEWPPGGFTAQRVRIAGWLCGVGSAKGRKKRAAYVARKLSELPVPVGWTKREMTLVRLAARYGAGDLPGESDREFRQLPQNAQGDVLRVSGVLRLAGALDRATNGTVGAPQAEARDGTRVIRVRGLDELSHGAEEIAAARHLLEYADGVPFLVLPTARSVRRAANNR
jgi:CHAD domain-containing protein